MLEKVYKLTASDEKIIEKVVMDENLHYIHMIFNKNQGASEHFSNSNVYMTVVRGKLSIALSDNEANEYEAGSLLKIPEGIKMNINNFSDETLELIVVKSPAPLR